VDAIAGTGRAVMPAPQHHEKYMPAKKSTSKKSATKKSASKKSSSTKSTGKKTSAKAQKKVGKVMHEYKHGQLKSGGKRKVTNPKQAIAIALSEARRSGAKVPPKKAASKKKSS